MTTDHPAQAQRRLQALLTLKRERTRLVSEVGRLHKHAAGTGGRVKNRPALRLQQLDQELHDTTGGEELPAPIAFSAGKVVNAQLDVTGAGVAANRVPARFLSTIGLIVT